MTVKDFNSKDQIAWCPGCGNFGIHWALRQALAESGLKPPEVMLVSGIGQAAKMPHYINANCFNGLHGRGLAVAAGAGMANRKLKIVVTTGDGDCYGEGGNHFLHNIRRNVDMTVIVHDNQIYGLTKGQASPTSEPGLVTKVQQDGTILNPFNPLLTALSLGAGFVARGFSKEREHLADIILAAMNYKGFSLVDVLQPCVSFNKLNTYKWYSERVYKLENDKNYNSGDKATAFAKAAEWGDRIPLGILYNDNKASCYAARSGLEERAPLVDLEIENMDISKALQEFMV